jgi:hypothetical protein
VLRAAPKGDRSPGRCARAVRLKAADPRLQRRLSKAAIPSESNVWDATRARLRPDPVGPDPEPLSDLLGGQLAVHCAWLVVGIVYIQVRGRSGRVPALHSPYVRVAPSVPGQ